jgi:hypothetical protein
MARLTIASNDESLWVLNLEDGSMSEVASEAVRDLTLIEGDMVVLNIRADAASHSWFDA